MKNITLGKTGITVPQNAFGALPIQRISKDAAVALLRRAYEGGMRFFDTARAYTDSEEKVGAAFEGMNDKIYIASKTQAKTGDELKRELETTLKNLKRDYLDLYQLHCVPQAYKPGDGTGLYEALAQAKDEGLVRHIGVTAHLLNVAEELVESGLYETLQFPLSYISSERDIELVYKCKEKDMGFIAMKALAGGLLTNARACMAFMSSFDNVLPIWGIQREEELNQWLAFFSEEAVLTKEDEVAIEADKKELKDAFCRGCGYCSPCTVGISVKDCARMSQMIRRAPSEAWLTEKWQTEMEKITECIECGVCMSRCPYQLNIPELLKKNLADYRDIVAGKIKV